MTTFFRIVCAGVLALALSACGGGGSDASLAGAGAVNQLPSAAPPDPNIVGKGVFTKDAKVFSAEQAANSELTDTQFTVRKPQANLYAVGDVLVVDAHGGRLIKIVRISETVDKIIYDYLPASLTAAFETLDVQLAGTIDSKTLGGSFTTNDPEVNISWKKDSIQSRSANQNLGAAGGEATAGVELALNTLEIEYKGLGVSSGIEINGSSSFKLNPDIQLNVYKNASDALSTIDLAASISPNLATTVSIASKFGGQVSYNLEKSFDLPAFRRVVIVPVGPVPVPVPFWIKPVVTISGALNGTAGSKFSTKYAYGINGKLGFARTAKDGLRGISEVTTTDSTVVSDVDSELGVNITAPKVEIHFQIYSFVGPNFDLGLENGVIGKSTTKGNPAIEGVEVVGTTKIKASGGIKAALSLNGVSGRNRLLDGFSGSIAPLSLTILDVSLQQRDWFFPYKTAASVTVFDNGQVPDDIFEVSLDNVVLGRTTKGGSGQFRLTNLRPGNRTLSVKTVEDDSPPGTYGVTLADGLRFSDGSTTKAGFITLGQSNSFEIVVPPSSP